MTIIMEFMSCIFLKADENHSTPFIEPLLKGVTVIFQNNEMRAHSFPLRRFSLSHYESEIPSYVT